MTDENLELNQENQKTQFIESLLDSLDQKHAKHSQELVSQGLRRINEHRLEATVLSETSRPRRLAKWRWLGLATAAMILVLILIPFPSGTKTAMASVVECIENSLADVGRHYSIRSRMKIGRLKTVDREADLFVKSDRFAIHGSVPVTGGDLWIGGDSKDAWVVPPTGPVLTGDTNSLREWVSGQKHVSSPFLHLSTILAQMQDDYQLEVLSNQVLLQLNGLNFSCRHIVGTLKNNKESGKPSKIELWADNNSKTAIRVQISWDKVAFPIGRESISLEFEEEASLSPSFFSADEHGGKGRSRIDL